MNHLNCLNRLNRLNRLGPRMEKRFQKLQQQLAAHIRDPENNPAPEGIDDERLQVYRRLFFNNIIQFTSNAFPILSAALGDEKWEQLNRSFYSKYQCHSPYFVEISKEFLQFLADYGKRDTDTLLIYELAHFEWTQFELAIADTADTDEATDGDLLNSRPVLSPLTRLLQYQWPVHQATVETLPVAPEATRLLAWRDADGRVHFMECNAVSAALLNSLQTRDDMTGTEHIAAALEASGVEAGEAAIAGGVQMLNDLKQRGVISGAR